MKLLNLIWCLLLSVPSYSVIPDFRHLTPQHGLNDGNINDIAQDSCGQMWFATWDGLMRYDGYQIRNYKPVIGDPNSIPAKQVSRLFVDSRDNLWISTRNGFCRYDKARDNFVIYNLGDSISRSYSGVRIQETGNFLIALHMGRMFYLESDSIAYTTFFKTLPVFDAQNQPVNYYFRIINLIKNEVWLGYRSPEINENVTTHLIKGRINPERPVVTLFDGGIELHGNITSILPYRDNQVFIATTGGLYHYYTLNNIPRPVEQARDLNIQELLISSDNKLWIATNNSGLDCIDLHSGDFTSYTHDPFQPSSILGNHILSLHEDFSGNLWVGFGGEGLSMLTIRQKPFSSYHHDPNNPNSLSTNTIISFNETTDELLIGTLYNGLISGTFDQKIQKYTFRNIQLPHYFLKSGENSVRVWKIVKEKDSIFWIGTNLGLIKAEKRKNNWYFEQFLGDEPISSIREILIDEKGNIWFGSYNGLYLIPWSKRNTMEYFHFVPSKNDPLSLSDRAVTVIFLDTKGRFWIGTQNGGLCLLNQKYEELDLSGHIKPELQFKRYYGSYQSDYTLNNNEINVLFEHNDGTIWIGTQGGGINILNPNSDEFRYITIDDGLAGEDVFSLLPDGKGNLWISTNKGLSRYNLFDHSFNNYSPSDGIQGNVFMVNSYFRSESGKLYFGGRNGFTCFNPSAITHNEIPPKISINGLKIFNRDVKIGEKINGKTILPQAISQLSAISLNHKNNGFSIGFSVIHYVNPGENMVEYVLEGFDKTWTSSPASVKYLTWNNLPPGEYTLRLKGGNADNVWTREVKELKIVILPPWYKTLLAKILVFLVLISAIVGIMMLVLHRQSLKHLLKIEKLEFERLKELNEEKLRFFTNISHELRTPLSLTIAPIEDIIARNDYSESYTRKQLSLAYRNARLLIRLITQIIDFRKLNAGKLKLEAEYSDFIILLRNVVNNFEAFKIEKNIQFSLIIPEEPYYLWFDIQKMEQILYNLLSNAFKFVRHNGSIEIRISTVQDSKSARFESGLMELVVYNDGEEIPDDQLDKIFERFHKVNSRSEGSGIGLSFTRSLVELHKGSIFAETVSGKGVKFVVRFPLGETHLTPEEKKQQDDLYKQKQLSNQTVVLHNEHEAEMHSDHELCILIVEDNNELREFFRTHFEYRYKVLEASNGVEGLTISEEYIPDIIITDIVMPEMDGFQMCRKIKENINTCHIPLIMLTAKDAHEYMVSGYDHGADAYVTKPFEIQILDQQIISLIKNRELIHERYRKRNFVIEVASSETSRDDLFIARVSECIESNLTDPEFGVNNLGKLLSLSSAQLYRKVKALTGYTPVELIRVVRLVKASELIKNSKLSIKEVCYKTGFNNPSYFIKCFKEHFKVTPNAYLSEANS